MQFEWDEVKEKKNIEKHGISFKTASMVFLDEQRLEFLMKCIVATKTDI